MDVDWITVAAQIANFLVLVWLLKRFLYGPIILAMDERDARIAGELREAQQKSEIAELEANRYQEMQEALEKGREARLAEVRKEAEAFSKSLQSASREEVASQRAEWMQSLSDEKADFLDDVRQRAAQAFSSMARKALRELANDKLEDQISRRFLKALGELNDQDRMNIQSACERAGASVAVHTAFDLTGKRRNEIDAALHDIIGKKVDIAFECTSDVICGIELRAGGQLVRWSIDSFLDELEAELRETIERRTPGVGRDAAE